jgi:hypothetical protein
MQTICAWCSQLIADDGAADNGAPSHGMCRLCLLRELGQLHQQQLEVNEHEGDSQGVAMRLSGWQSRPCGL